VDNQKKGKKMTIRFALAAFLCSSLAACGGGGGGGGDSDPAQPPPVDENIALLAAVLEDSSSAGGANNADGEAITADQLADIRGLNNVILANEVDYQASIGSETQFSDPVTVAQVQRLVDSVNALQNVVNAADAGDASGITTDELQSIVGISAVQPRLQSLYQQSLSALPGTAVDSAVELQTVINAVNGGDSDRDGLSNQAEAIGFTVVIDGTERQVLPNPESPDSDNDGLSDGYELYFVLGNWPSQLANPPADNNGDGVAGTQRDAVLAATFGVSDRAAIGLVDRNGDGQPRDRGIPWYNGSGWSYVSTDPTRADSDGDRVFDAAEAGLQLTFRLYRGFDALAGSNLLGRLHPASSANAPAVNRDYATEVALEQDSDGGGRPDIEEWWAATDTAKRTDDLRYVGCSDAGTPDANGTRGTCTETRKWAAMTAANFRYVPGGFDVNGDGVAERGFWIAQFEAKSAGGLAVDPEPAAGGNSMAAYLAVQHQVYNPASGQFEQILCINGGHAADTNADGITVPGTLPAGCRSSEYPISGWNNANALPASAAAITSPVLNFVPVGLPLTAKMSIEATIGLAGSPVAGSYSLVLPSAIDWMQLVGVALHDERNWTNANGNGLVEPTDGVIFRGHTDGRNRNGNTATALPIDVTDTNDYTLGYYGTGDGTEYASFADGVNDLDQRRTLVLANGMASRDFGVPLNHAVVIWDVAGNVWEWTRGLVAARIEVSASGTQPGGDRFLGGAAQWAEFNSDEVRASSMPDWWKPVLPHFENQVLDSTAGAGTYYDGTSATGAAFNAGSSFGSDFASVRRGGHWSNSGLQQNSGVATTILESGPDDRRAGVGFRAVELR
jgi:hypothetical protein